MHNKTYIPKALRKPKANLKFVPYCFTASRYSMHRKNNTVTSGMVRAQQRCKNTSKVVTYVKSVKILVRNTDIYL
jgi:hypothetical protein